MRPLTAVELQSLLDDDLVWRRREMTTLITLIKTVGAVDKNALIRAGVPLLYAHWEGFGRTCGTRYLEHVSYRRLKFKNLKPAFLFMASIGTLSEIHRSAHKEAIPLLETIAVRANQTNKDNFRKKVNTRSNLRYDVLVDLLTMCGLDHTPFATDESFINDELCDPRNAIAHGIGGAPFEATFVNRRDRAFDVMKKLQNTVVNAAAAELYRA